MLVRGLSWVSRPGFYNARMSLMKSASTVSLLTLASRITGLIRELLVASAFGASATTDAFQVAFRIPNLLRRLFAEGAFSQAFVPILAESRTRQGDEATHKLINAVGSVLFWVLLLVSLLGVLAAPGLVWLMASGLKESGGFDAAVVMTRWMFPYIFCMSLVALSAGILNTWGHFAVPAATPVLLNLCVIGAALFLAPVLAAHGISPVMALAIGVMIGGVVQLAVQVPALARRGVVPQIAMSWSAIKAAWSHDGVHRILRQMAPALLGVSVAQLSLLVNTQIASHLGAGAVSWLTYADRLMEFPTAMLGVALGVVLLPQLSKAQAKGDAAEFSALLDWGLRLVMLLALPAAVGLVIFAKPVVTVLYHYGRFTAHDVDQTVLALMGYGVGLMGLIGVKILAPGFYARQDIRTPVRIGISVLVLTQVLNVVFVPWLAQAGLALSIGLASLVNAGWLLLGLRRAGLYKPEPGWLSYALRVVVATGLVAAGMWWAAHDFDWVALRSQPLLRVALLAACMAAVVGVYFAALMAMGLKLRQMLRR
jgi:putative peptidoglycan lipid II flippase